MRPDERMSFTNVTTADDLARNEARFQVEVKSVVHWCPLLGSGLTPCCDRSPVELSVWDRLTEDPEAVTCAAHIGSRDGSDV